MITMTPGMAATYSPPHHDAHATAGPGWYESSRELLCGLDVRELGFAECRYTAGGGAELALPSAT